ncbi:MAG: molybdenum cofactor biosynthesis protein B [bacterium]
MPIKVAILTISTRGSEGKRKQDKSGDTIKNIIRKIDGQVADYKVIRDDQEQIMWELKRLAEVVKVDLVLTTGGTGLSPTDVTPEATLAVIERRVPGLEEAMRMSGFRKTPHALLSRAVAGTLERTLIINLPGTPKGVQENLETILETIPHAVEVLRGGFIADKQHQYNQPNPEQENKI